MAYISTPLTPNIQVFHVASPHSYWEAKGTQHQQEAITAHTLLPITTEVISGKTDCTGLNLLITVTPII